MPIKKENKGSGKFKGHIEIMQNHSHYTTSMNLSNLRKGIEYYIQDEKINFDTAPTNPDGNIGLFELQSNGILYIDGIPYYDANTKEYHPDLPSDKNKQEQEKYISNERINLGGITKNIF